jgi:hypothetical protein
MQILSILFICGIDIKWVSQVKKLTKVHMWVIQILNALPEGELIIYLVPLLLTFSFEHTCRILVEKVSVSSVTPNIENQVLLETYSKTYSHGEFDMDGLVNSFVSITWHKFHLYPCCHILDIEWHPMFLKEWWCFISNSNAYSTYWGGAHSMASYCETNMVVENLM